MALEEKKNADIETEHAEHVNESEVGAIDKADFVPSIEEAAASKAAWLISVTVSLGGFVRRTFSPMLPRNENIAIVGHQQAGQIKLLG